MLFEAQIKGQCYLNLQPVKTFSECEATLYTSGESADTKLHDQTSVLCPIDLASVFLQSIILGAVRDSSHI